MRPVPCEPLSILRHVILELEPYLFDIMTLKKAHVSSTAAKSRCISTASLWIRYEQVSVHTSEFDALLPPRCFLLYEVRYSDLLSQTWACLMTLNRLVRT